MRAPRRSNLTLLLGLRGKPPSSSAAPLFSWHILSQREPLLGFPTHQPRPRPLQPQRAWAFEVQSQEEGCFSLLSAKEARKSKQWGMTLGTDQYLKHDPAQSASESSQNLHWRYFTRIKMYLQKGTTRNSNMFPCIHSDMFI